MADKKWNKTGLAETATGVGIAGYAPNAIYHAETKHIKNTLAGYDARIKAHNANKPGKPAGVKDANGNIRAASKEAKVAHIAASKQHTKQGQAMVNARKLVGPKIYPKQTKLWLGSAAVGLPLAYHGARKQVGHKDPFEKRKISERDVGAATLGGTAGYGVYQGGAIVGSKPYEHKAAAKIRNSPQHKATLDAHKQATLGDKRAPITTGDKSLRGKYFHKYPTSLPGGKFKRAVSWTHTGPTGVAATGLVAGLSAKAAVDYSRKHEKVHKALKTQEQIDRRKKIGANVGRVSAGLGLAGLGVLGAGAAAPKLAQTGKFTRITAEGAKNFKAATAKHAATTTVVGGGISGANGFNAASWQSAEAKQKKRKQGIVKNHYGEFDSGMSFGEDSDITKALTMPKFEMPKIPKIGGAGAHAGPAGPGSGVGGTKKGPGAVSTSVASTKGFLKPLGQKASQMGQGVKAGATGATPMGPHTQMFAQGKSAGAGALRAGQSLKAHPVATGAGVTGAAGLGTVGMMNHNRNQAMKQKGQAFTKRSPEDRRMDRSDVYRRTADVAAGAAGIGAGHQAYKTGKHLKAANISHWGGKAPKIVANAGPLKAAGKSGGRAVLLAGGAAGAAYAGRKVKQKQSTDWAPYVSKAAGTAHVTNEEMYNELKRSKRQTKGALVGALGGVAGPPGSALASGLMAPEGRKIHGTALGAAGGLGGPFGGAVTGYVSSGLKARPKAKKEVVKSAFGVSHG